MEKASAVIRGIVGLARSLGMKTITEGVECQRQTAELKTPDTVLGLLPEQITLPADTQVRSSKYLNNPIEQNHRNIESRTKVILGFGRFRSAANTISDIELVHRIRKVSSIAQCFTSRRPLHRPVGTRSSRLNKPSSQNPLPRLFPLFAPEPV
jgi:DDE domain